MFIINDEKFTKRLNVIFAFLLFVLLLDSIQQSIAQDDDLEVVFFNVGQGNCTLIRCPNGPPLLYDAGSTAHPLGGVQKNEIVNKVSLLIDEWRRSGCNPNLPHLNVVISHGDLDHYNLIKEITDQIPNRNQCNIQWILGGSQNEYNVNFGESGESVIYTSSSDQIVPPYCGDVDCKVLSAITENIGSSSEAKNRKSIVLYLTHKNKSFALMGDADIEVENRILQTLNGDIKINTLLLGHHGAMKSTGDEFVTRTQPETCVISAKSSKHHHPQILPIAHVASYVKILDNPIQFSFCHGKELYNPIITNLAIFNTQNLGDITIKGDNFSYTESNTSLADYVVHTKLDEKFIDLTKCGKSFWAKEFKNLTKDFDKSIIFFLV